MPDTGGAAAETVLAGAGGLRAPAEVFDDIFVVFLALGTLVGVVVVSYTLYNAYRYRYREDIDPAPEADRPELGELPSGGGKGRKLFLSFGLSAVIVLSLVLWTYGTLLYVENTPENFAAENGEGELLDVHVEGYRFGWSFTYPNGHTTDTLRVPTDRLINLTVTTRDVFHNFGIPEMRVKSDAIPGQTTNTWFVAESAGEYRANCYELCGSGHSYMTADVVAMEPDAYGEWYAGTNGTADNGPADNGPADNGTAGDGTATESGVRAPAEAIA